MVSSAPSTRCRQISEADVAAVTALLARGFPVRDRQFWERAMQRLHDHEPAPGLPHYGYLLESDGKTVGAILLICSTVSDGHASPQRCNLSSWYVEPEFRAWAPLLVSRALAHKNVTYVNVSPAPHTRPIIEAQGFRRYSDGVFLGLPMFSALCRRAGVRVFDASERPNVPYEAFEEEILLQHAKLGCISLWCAGAERAYPFVFRTRLLKRFIPCTQLIYCRGVAEFVRCAGPLGRYLALRGRPLVIVDANGPVPGLVGAFSRGSMPKYFKGPQRPRLGDLAYTEYAVMGV